VRVFEIHELKTRTIFDHIHIKKSKKPVTLTLRGFFAPSLIQHAIAVRWHAKKKRHQKPAQKKASRAGFVA